MELNTARGRLFLFLLFLLAFPFLNRHLKIIRSSPLYGIINKGAPGISLKNWWDGTYQDQQNIYVNDNIGFREDMIRLNNQLDLSFFNKINSRNLVMGRRHNLFFNDYIDAYCGDDFAGDDSLTNNAIKMKKLQDTLQHLGKLFVLLHAPSKASFFPEDIPAEILCRDTAKTNYKRFKQICDSIGISQVDFNSWFRSLKGNTPHPLYNKQGIHWSIYGAQYAVDSLIKYIAVKRSINMIKPAYGPLSYSANAIRSDNDIEQDMNIIFPVDTGGYWYRQMIYIDSPGKIKPKIIYIGDSYGWGLVYNGIMNSNTDPQFWYYFDIAYSRDFDIGPVSYSMAHYDWRGFLNKADCIVLIYTETQIIKLSSIFIDSAYNYYYPHKH